MKIAISHSILKPVYAGYANGTLSNRLVFKPNFLSSYFLNGLGSKRSTAVTTLVVSLSSRAYKAAKVVSPRAAVESGSALVYLLLILAYFSVLVTYILNLLYLRALRLPPFENEDTCLSSGRQQALIEAWMTLINGFLTVLGIC